MPAAVKDKELMNQGNLQKSYDAVIIGGGFYGCCLALSLRMRGARVLIIEKEAELLMRASYANQARVHNGYHYPRNFITALRSCVNFPRFVAEFRACIDDSFEKVYAIARNHSKVNAFQFLRACRNFGAPVKTAPAPIKKLFDGALVEEAFLVEEYAFNAVRLRELLRARLAVAQVDLCFSIGVDNVSAHTDGRLALKLDNGDEITGTQVFNCAYAQINTILRNSGLPLLPMKHEIAELALVEVPDKLKRLGITVMDGPFFSVMPFPARALHSLSHVRYTPHESWQDEKDYHSSQACLQQGGRHSHNLFMRKDAQRYLPLLAEARYVESLFEVKTVLKQNETNDGRPILYREHYGLRNFFIIMGGKIDNIYDILQRIDEQQQPAVQPCAAVIL
jgi:L-2-hydroxyglutarate oxidase LhgO